MISNEPSVKNAENLSLVSLPQTPQPYPPLRPSGVPISASTRQKGQRCVNSTGVTFGFS